MNCAVRLNGRSNDRPTDRTADRPSDQLTDLVTFSASDAIKLATTGGAWVPALALGLFRTWHLCLLHLKSILIYMFVFCQAWAARACAWHHGGHGVLHGQPGAQVFFAGGLAATRAGEWRQASRLPSVYPSLCIPPLAASVQCSLVLYVLSKAFFL